MGQKKQGPEGGQKVKLTKKPVPSSSKPSAQPTKHDGLKKSQNVATTKSQNQPSVKPATTKQVAKPADQDIPIPDPFWIFRPGISPLSRRIFYVSTIGLLVTLVVLFVLMFVNEQPATHFVHVGVFFGLAVGLLASATWVLSMIDAEKKK